MGDNFKAIAISVQLIDDTEKWIANNTIFVQMGDLTHRRENNVKVVQKLFEYKQEAPKHNSDVFLIIGNHDYEQIKWNPAQKSVFQQQGSWYMPDYKQFHKLKMSDQLRKLRLIYKINGFVFTHAGIEKKHLDAAGTTNINELNEMMSDYFQSVTFKNQDANQWQTERKVASTVWLQWLHDHKRQNTPYCHKVDQVLDLLDAHTIIVGHYFPSSLQSIGSKCNGNIIFADIGIWYNYYDALIIEDDKIQTLSGSIIENSMRRKDFLSATQQGEKKEEL